MGQGQLFGGQRLCRVTDGFLLSGQPLGSDDHLVKKLGVGRHCHVDDPVGRHPDVLHSDAGEDQCAACRNIHQGVLSRLVGDGAVGGSLYEH